MIRKKKKFKALVWMIQHYYYTKQPIRDKKSSLSKRERLSTGESKSSERS
jgi:hypothetical protein